MKNNFIDVYNNYLVYLKIKDKPQSYVKIKNRIDNHIKPYFKDFNIEDITPLEYMKWLGKIEEKEYSFKYKKSLHYAFVTFFNYCIIFYDIKKNVPSLVGGFKNREIKNERKFWNYEEFKKFINCISDDDLEYKILFDFLFFSGCRLGEANALKFNDINFDNSDININKTLSKEFINGERYTSTPKTKSSIRKIKIDKILLKELKILKDKYIKQYKEFNNDYFVFGGSKPLAPTTINRKKNHYCKIAKVNEIRLHDFRHSHASILISKGVPITDVSKRLGHSNTNITLEIYAHALDNDEKRVINTLDSLRHNID